MTIAITGATGFLGLRLLPLLMERGHQVVVLAHAGTAPAHDRIERHFRANGTPVELAQTLTVLLSDLTRPRLGLSQLQFRALAPALTEIWHCGALTDLAAPARKVRPVNTDGTRAVLELATAGTAMLYHVSTAFVAGRRRTGLIGEGDLDASYGFENPYEESKYDGERAVHEWSREHGRSAIIFRPSVLITDQRPPPGGATHPMLTASKLADFGRAFSAPERGIRFQVRLEGVPEAHINMIPVELAARLMVELADRVQPRGVDTAHITYPHEVQMDTMASLFERRFAIQIQIVPESPRVPTPLEMLISKGLRGFAPYGFQHRYYDRSALKRSGLDPSGISALDLPYLLAAT